MAGRTLKGLAHCASVLGALVALPGCVDDGVALHVICPVFPEIEEGACIFDPSGETCVLEGVLNVDVAKVYKQSLRVESGLKARDRAVPPRGETNGIQIRGATVDVRVPTGERFPFTSAKNPFYSTGSGFVPPEEFGAVSLTLLTEAHINDLRAHAAEVPEIVIWIEVKGETSGAQSITAGEYRWPVRLVTTQPCISMSYCVSMLGQDGFAHACRL